jgi:hypothetical protein
MCKDLVWVSPAPVLIVGFDWAAKLKLRPEAAAEELEVVNVMLLVS